MAGNVAIIKVGSTSTSRFRNIKCYRAITIKEMAKLNDIQSDNILIIEHIDKTEYHKAADFLRSEMGKGSRGVFFFVPDNDETTTGLADELCADIYLNLKDLYRAISINCGLEVDPDISITRADSDDNGFITEFDSQFEDEIMAASEAMYGSVDIDYSNDIVILNREEAGLGLSNFTDDELGIVVEIEEVFTSTEIAVEEKPEVEHRTLEEAAEISEALAALGGVSIEELEAARSELKASKESEEYFKNKADEAVARVLELNKVVKAVKDERDILKMTLKELDESDIIEDPATLSEYNSIKDMCEQLKSQLANSTSISSAELLAITAERDKSVADVERISAELEIAKAEKNEADDKLGELTIALALANKELTELRDSSELDDKINELTDYSAELQTKIDTLQEQNSQANKRVNALENEIHTVRQSLIKELRLRAKISELLVAATDKLKTTVELQQEVQSLQESLAGLKTNYDRVCAELKDKSDKLEKVSADTEHRVNLARNFAKEETEALRQDNIAMQSKLMMLESQLNAANTQYTGLVALTGMDESGANILAENNRTLESLNVSLRTQLSDLKTAYESTEREKVEMRQSIIGLQERNQRLTSQIKAMSSGYSGGAGVGMIPPIVYSGRAQILTFIGSGSYGVTTTAYTAATMLSNSHRVLFIDFDMISAKADAWFRMSPIIKTVPGVNPNHSKSTGLGILIDRGTSFFLTFANQIIQRTNKTKGGHLDYLSGFYDKPDVVKLVSADFKGLLNYCGNSYEYIVIDFGRIGASDINNQIIKLFSDISRTTVVVTSSDKIDIRNTKLEMQKMKLNIENMAWLVNLAENTKIDDRTKSNLSPARYAIMPFIDDFYGKRLDFLQTKQTRDRFRPFLDKNILER